MLDGLHRRHVITSLSILQGSLQLLLAQLLDDGFYVTLAGYAALIIRLDFTAFSHELAQAIETCANTCNLTHSAAGRLVHLGNAGRSCRCAPQQIRHEAQLLVRIVLLVREVLIANIQGLLSLGLIHAAIRRLQLVDVHALLELLTAKLTEGIGTLHSGLQALHTKTSAVLARLFTQLLSGLTILSAHASSLQTLACTELTGLLVHLLGV